MRRSQLLATLLACGALSACSLLTNLDGLAGADDAGVGGGDARGGDAGNGDGDAAGDSARPDGATSFCATMTPTPTFCDDFDEGPLTGWTRTIDDGGTLDLDNASAASAPESLRVTLAPHPTGKCAYAYADHTMSLAYTKSVRFAYDVRMGHAGASGGFGAVAMNSIHTSAANGSGGCDHYIIVSPTIGKLTCESSAGQAVVDMPFIQEGAWTHVEMLLDGASAPVRLSVSLNGGAPTVMTASAQCSFGMFSGLTLGLFCYSDTTDTDMRVDNAAVWVE